MLSIITIHINLLYKITNLYSPDYEKSQSANTFFLKVEENIIS